MMTSRNLLTVAVIALAICGDTLAQSWYREDPATAPQARRFHAMGFDPARAVTVLFGGADEPNGKVFGDTWEFDGAEWSLRAPAGPPARQRFAACFDRARAAFVVFGGLDAAGQLLGDTWRWDGKAWARLTTTNAPSPRLDAQMAFDTARGRVVLFGGRPTDASQPFADTWELDGSDWLQRSPAASPDARFGHAMTFDAARRVTVLFGGFAGSSSTRSDTWEYDGSTWRRIATATSPSGLVFPSLAFHSGHGVAVLTGGSGNQTQALATFAFDGIDWQAGPTAPRELTSRQGHATAFDDVREALVLFGGASIALGGARPHADTWELSAPAAFEPFGTGCATSAGLPKLGAAANGRPEIGRDFVLEVAPLPSGVLPLLMLGVSDSSWGSLALPLELTPLGLPGCRLFTSVDNIVPMTLATAAARATLRVPLDRGLLERQLFAQALLLGAERATSNAGRLVLGN